MFFVPCGIGRHRNPLALVPKKSIALQLGRRPSAGVVHVLGKSSASVTASLAGQAPPTMVPVPSVGRADADIQGAPLEVVEQLVTAVVPLPTALVALTVAGMTQPVVTPLTQVEVAAAMIDGS